MWVRRAFGGEFAFFFCSVLTSFCQGVLSEGDWRVQGVWGSVYGWSRARLQAPSCDKGGKLEGIKIVGFFCVKVNFPILHQWMGFAVCSELASKSTAKINPAMKLTIPNVRNIILLQWERYASCWMRGIIVDEIVAKKAPPLNPSAKLFTYPEASPWSR